MPLRKAVQCIDFVKIRRLGAYRDQRADLWNVGRQQEVDRGDAAQAVCEQHDWTLLRIDFTS